MKTFSAERFLTAAVYHKKNSASNINPLSLLIIFKFQKKLSGFLI